MSARSASIRWPGVPRWRWSGEVIRDRRRGRRHRSISAAAFRSRTRTSSRLRSALSSPRSRPASSALACPNARLWAEPGRALVAGGGIGRRAGAAPPRRRAVRQRWRVRRAGRRRRARLPLSGAADPSGRRGSLHAARSASRSSAPPATAPTRCAGRSTCRPTSHGRRLDRDRPARCLWRLPAHRVQWLRSRPPGRGDATRPLTHAAPIAHPPGRLITAAVAQRRPGRPSRSANRGTARSLACRRSPRGPRCR